MYSQFGVGLARMARTIKERMNVRDNEDFKPVDLINARTLSSVINSFFGTNQLSQFMDQTNVRSFRSFNRTQTAIVRVVYVTNLETGSFTTQTTWPER